MHTISINLGKSSHKIEIDSGALGKAGERILSTFDGEPRTAVIVSNPTVSALYGRRLQASLRRAGFKALVVLIGDGERVKNLDTANSIFTFLVEHRIERRDVIVALGGGVVGDVAGFVAATYLRGIAFVQVPTTLLAQIDSSIGGKTGVNHKLGKNLIGAFHQPSLVLIDPAVLATLPPRELRSGLFEAIKYGVIRDKRLFNRIASEAEKLTAARAEELDFVISRSCRIKADVVSKDEREAGLRRILNFGHTIGHAMEAVTHYRKFHHGEAVAYGMRAAAQIAEVMELLPPEGRQAVDYAIGRVGKLPPARSLAPHDIIGAMKRDKKSISGRVAFVLPVEVGRVVIRNDVPLSCVRRIVTDLVT
ncbi:MAG TPA: 3-dehydroquinate synthase [Blastocatellia bacterium]|nr:3-dehydroquinate synthase [Blastocatellia bacterium]